MTRLYLDLDGLLADFDIHYEFNFGKKTPELTDDNKWKRIKSYPDFFLDMPLCDGALDFFKKVEYLSPIILTSCPKSDYYNSAIQKKRWVRQNLSSSIHVIPMLGGTNKHLFMHSPGDILIDDYEKNCKSWIAHGGRAIHHKNFYETKIQLANIIHI